MQTWVERFPGRLEYELADFARRKLEFALDEEQLAEQGRVVLTGFLPYEGEEVRLEVRYPDLFPYLRPVVIAPDLNRDRHQDPYSKELCLLEPSTRAWDTDATGAWLVEKRVPYLLRLLDADPETLRRAEVPQGEPVASYFEGPPGSVVFVPQAALGIPAQAQAGSGRLAFSVGEPPRPEVRAVIAEVVEKDHNKKTKTLAKADEPLLAHFGGEQIPFRWARLPRAPDVNTPQGILEALEASRTGFGSPPWHAVHGGRIGVAAALFQEEVRQGDWEDTWVFVVQVRLDSQDERSYLIRGQRLSRHDLEDRLPVGLALGGRTVSLVGLGSVGSGLAFELARAGLGELRGMDADKVEAGTTVRWLLGQGAAGRLKVGALGRRMAGDYPYTEFKGYLHRLGQSAGHKEARVRTELDILAEFLDGADLVVDASAEIGVQQVLAELAAERGLPQLYVSTTEGAQGGLVARVVPGITGCWMCLQRHLDDNKEIPAPPRNKTATVQPRGCSTLTFRGAGFDIEPVIAQGARVAASMLSDEDEGDDGRCDVFICAFGEGRLLPPQWSAHPLTPHPECSTCGGS
jgi:molybdopterin/thiamine biosynthesis adenylyltransferase